MATLNEMFKTLTKKQRESLECQDCREDYENAIKQMYEYNTRNKQKK